MSTEYKQIYDDFLTTYKKGTTSGEDVGEAIARLAQCFAQQNLAVAYDEIQFNTKAAEIEQGDDPATGKKITSSKAKILSQATDEHTSAMTSKAHLQNIEQYINALKYLQKGMLNEYSHMGSM